MVDHAGFEAVIPPGVAAHVVTEAEPVQVAWPRTTRSQALTACAWPRSRTTSGSFPPPTDTGLHGCLRLACTRAGFPPDFRHQFVDMASALSLVRGTPDTRG